MKLISLISTIFLTGAVADTSELWLKQLPPHTKNSAAYGQICNSSDKDLKIRSISSNYGNVQLHSMTMRDGMMKMTKLRNVTVRAKSCFVMKPGANHMMIMGIKTQAVAGEKIDFLVKFSDNSTLNLSATVKKTK